MRLAAASFTAAGEALAGRLAEGLSGLGYEVVRADCLRGAGKPRLGAWTEKAFADCDGLVYIGACGIAVRAIAPFLRNKTADPAVITVDEQGRYVVSLLSGHLGGANRLAADAAAVLGATPVISTATDLNGRFAVDLWARARGLALDSRELAKAISAALLDGREVGFCSDFPVDGPLPEGLRAAEGGALGVCVTLDEQKRPFDATLRAFPRIVTLGAGCRKGVAPEAFESAVLEALARERLPLAAAVGLASIDLKRDEPCMAAFARKYGLSFSCHPAAALAGARGEFSTSGFVERVTGVDNVCERAAVVASGGTLYFGKRAGSAVTVAAAISNWRVRFGYSDGGD